FCPVDLQADRLEALDPVGPARGVGEVAAQLGPGAKRGSAVGCERVADVGALGVQGSQLVELRFALRRLEVAGDEPAHPRADSADDLGGIRGCGHASLSLTE